MKKLSRGGLWTLMIHIGRMLRRSCAEPYSDKFNRWLIGLWTLSTCIAVANIALNLFLVTHMSWFWIIINCFTAAFDMTMLYWSILGFFYRKDVRQREAEHRQFIDMMLNAYADDK